MYQRLDRRSPCLHRQTRNRCQRTSRGIHEITRDVAGCVVWNVNGLAKQAGAQQQNRSRDPYGEHGMSFHLRTPDIGGQSFDSLVDKMTLLVALDS